MARKSTIQPASAETQAWMAKHQNVQSMQGVKVGRLYKLPKGIVQVMSIFRYSNRQPWTARVKEADRSEHGMPLSVLAKAVHSRAKHPVLRCYAQGAKPIRRLKVNPRTANDPDLRRAVGLFKSFREQNPTRVKTVDYTLPKAVAHIGTCEFVGYVTTHQGKPALYVHYFAPGSRPNIYGNTGRGEVVLRGMRFKLTSGGFTDLDAKGRIVDFKPRFKVFRVDKSGRIIR